jgi:hypothetical protein
MNGYEFFKIYFPLHLHFTSSYDVIKYGGKTKSINITSFNSRKDRAMFEKWGNKVENAVKAGQVVISNLVYNNNNFIYQDVEDAFDIYYEWKKTRESLSEVFKNDCRGLVEHFKKLGSWDRFLSKTPSGNTAPLLQVYQHKRVHPESIVIFDSITVPFIEQWEVDYAVDPLISDNIFTLTKYKPFVKYDKEKVVNIFKEQLNQNE